MNAVPYWPTAKADAELDWAGPGFSQPYMERYAEPEEELEPEA